MTTFTADQMHTITPGAEGTLANIPVPGSPTRSVRFLRMLNGHAVFESPFVADPIFVPADCDATFTPED